MILTEAAIIEGERAAGKIADACKAREERLMVQLQSGDAELIQMAKEELRRRNEAEEFFHDLGVLPRKLADWVASQIENG